MRRIGVIGVLALLAGLVVGGGIASPAVAASPPSISIAPGAGDESVGGKPGQVRLAVTLSDPSTSVVTVDWSFVAVSATSVDVVKTAGTVTFKPSSRTGLTPTTKYVVVRTVPDGITEGPEVFDVRLSHPTAGHVLGREVATGAILDTRTAATIAARDAAVVEGDTGVKNTIKIPVTLGAAPAAPVGVDVAVTGGTASPGVDYKAMKPRTLTFKPGQTKKTLSISVTPDLVAEPGESVVLSLSNPTGGATLATTTITAGIVDDDQPPPPGGLVVNTSVDSHDAAPGDGVCADTTGACSLRAAVDELNAAPPVPAVIVLAADPELSIAGAGDDQNVSGDIDIRVPNVEIRGNGHTIDANGIDRVLHATATATRLSVVDTTITGGALPTGSGGGIAADDLQIERSTIVGNAAGPSGGGIFVTGDISIVDSTISSNRASSGFVAGQIGSGGGVHATDGPVLIRGTTMTDNQATTGGGLFASSTGAITITASTFSANRATISGSAVVLRQVATPTGPRITDATFVGNNTSTIQFSAPTCDRGPGCPFPPGVLTVTRTIIAPGGSAACVLGDGGPSSQTVVNGGSNLIASGGACTFGDPADPKLGPLADNGGPTRTHLPLAGSPAIDGGGTCTGVDQRGVTRPQRAACDIGAVERTT